MVYIQEAHPSDSWQVAANLKDKVIFSDPASFAERAGIAGACVRKLGIEFPALVDTIDNATEDAYTAWPDRLYVVASDGRIAFKSTPGPFGFKPRLVEETLQTLVSRSPVETSPVFSVRRDENH